MLLALPRNRRAMDSEISSDIDWLSDHKAASSKAMILVAVIRLRGPVAR